MRPDGDVTWECTTPANNPEQKGDRYHHRLFNPLEVGRANTTAPDEDNTKNSGKLTFLCPHKYRHPLILCTHLIIYFQDDISNATRRNQVTYNNSYERQAGGPNTIPFRRSRTSTLTSNETHTASGSTRIQDKCNDNFINCKLIGSCLACRKDNYASTSFHSIRSPSLVRNTRRWEYTAPSLILLYNG